MSGAGSAVCSGVLVTECVHVGGVPGAAGDHNYYNTIGVCAGTEAAD